MKFLVDAQLSQSLCKWFDQRGHMAAHVSSSSDHPLSDRAIAAWAERDRLILVSKDADFAALRRPNRFAFMWLRCGNLSTCRLLAWLEPQWPETERSLVAGQRMIEVR